MAADRNLDLALRIKAEVDDARTKLRGLQEQITQTGSAAKGATASTSAQAKATDSAAQSATANAAALAAEADATNAAAKAELERTARIHAMVQASLAQRDADVAAGAAAQSAYAAEAKRTEGAVASVAARTAAARAAAAERASVVAQMADYAVLQRILDGNVKETSELAAAEAALDRLQKRGAITVEELTLALAALNKVTDKNTVANVANAASRSVGNSRAYAEIGTAASEVAAGNFGRLRRTGAAFLNQSGALAKLFTPVGLAITGVVASLGALAVAFAKGEAESTAYAKALALTGNYADVSVGQLESYAVKLDAVTGVTEHAAAGAIAMVAATGKFRGETIELVAKAALQMQQLGQDAKTTVGQFEAIGKDPVAALAKLNDSMHFLHGSTLQQVMALQEQGKQEQAIALAQSTYADAVSTMQTSVHANLGLLQRGWDGVKDAASEAWDAMLDIGRKNSLDAQIAKISASITGARARLQDLLAHPDKITSTTILSGPVSATSFTKNSDLVGSATRGLNRLLSERLKLQQQLVAQLAASGTLFTTGEDDTKQRAALAKELAFYSSTVQAEKTALAAENEQYRQAMLSKNLTDAEREHALAAHNARIAEIRKKFEPRAAKPKAGPSADALTKAAAAANAQLATSYNQLLGAIDPVAAANNRYNSVVDRANAAAQTNIDKIRQLVALKKLDAAAAAQQIARIEDTVRGIKILAAGARDAALDDIANTDRKAWQKLLDSLRTPAQVNVDTAIAKLKELQKLFNAGDSGMTHAQFTQAAAQIGTQSGQQAGTKAPQYKGITNDIGFLGNIGSQLNQNFDAQKQLDAWYKAQQDAAKAFHATSEAEATAHAARMAAIDKHYSDEKKKIDDARGIIALQGASALFGQLATLSSSHNRTMAKIGKAAAIAQAIINTYQSATAAYASLAGIYLIGPELGAAAAAVAIAAGLANVAQIRQQQVGQYAAGGAIRGPGTPTSDSVPIMASAGEYMHRAAAVRYYGMDFMDAVNGLAIPRFARGGLVSSPADFANTPPPQFAATPLPAFNAPASAAASGAAATQHVKVVVVMNPEQMTEEIMNTPAGHKVIVQTAGNNPNAIKSRWGS